MQTLMLVSRLYTLRLDLHSEHGMREHERIVKSSDLQHAST